MQTKDVRINPLPAPGDSSSGADKGSNNSTPPNKESGASSGTTTVKTATASQPAAAAKTAATGDTGPMPFAVAAALLSAAALSVASRRLRRYLPL